MNRKIKRHHAASAGLLPEQNLAAQRMNRNRSSLERSISPTQAEVETRNLYENSEYSELRHEYFGYGDEK